MRIAIVREGVVENVPVLAGDAQIITPAELQTLLATGADHATIKAAFVPPSGTSVVILTEGQACDPGWLVDGDGFTAPAAKQPINDLYTYAADKRWRIATSGLTVPLPGGGSISVPSDDTAYGRLKGVAEDLATGVIFEPITIVINSTVVAATLGMVTALYAAISQHWQECYRVQGLVVAAVAGGTITTTDQIDDPTLVGLAAWPGA